MKNRMAYVPTYSTLCAYLNDDKYTLLQNESDIDSLVEYLGKDWPKGESVTGAIVAVGNGDYDEIYVCFSSRPFDLNAIYWKVEYKDMRPYVVTIGGRSVLCPSIESARQFARKVVNDSLAIHYHDTEFQLVNPIKRFTAGKINASDEPILYGRIVTINRNGQWTNITPISIARNV